MKTRRCAGLVRPACARSQPSRSFSLASTSRTASRRSSRRLRRSSAWRPVDQVGADLLRGLRRGGFEAGAAGSLAPPCWFCIICCIICIIIICCCLERRRVGFIAAPICGRRPGQHPPCQAARHALVARGMVGNFQPANALVRFEVNIIAQFLGGDSLAVNGLASNALIRIPIWANCSFSRARAAPSRSDSRLLASMMLAAPDVEIKVAISLSTLTGCDRECQAGDRFHAVLLDEPDRILVPMSTTPCVITTPRPPLPGVSSTIGGFVPHLPAAGPSDSRNTGPP